jgi:flagellin-like hook-associated protein FlgL
MQRAALCTECEEAIMGLSVTTNIAAMTAHRHLSTSSDAMSTSLRRLSSGYRITRASDDAAGLAISEGLRSQIGGMTQAVRNTQDGINVVQTAEGALNETTSILQRMRDLAVQAANTGALNGEATASIQEEIGQLRDELTRVAETTSYDGTPLLDGSYTGTFQVGANAGETIVVNLDRAVGAGGLGLDGVDVTVTSGAQLTATVTPAVSAAAGTPASGRLVLAGDFNAPDGTAFAGLTGTISYAGKSLDLAKVDYSGATTAQDFLDALNAAAVSVFGTAHTPITTTSTALYFTGDVPGAGSTDADATMLTPAYTPAQSATTTVSTIDAALRRVSWARADLGAVQNRFEHTIRNLNVSIENTAASESRIRDTDMAAEMTRFSRNQVLIQAGTSMLAQATQSTQSVLKLLG